MKRCQTCKAHKHISEFNKKRTNPDGLQKTCRCCQAIGRKSYYDRNKEKEFASHSAYIEVNKSRVNAKRAKTRASDPTFYKRRQQYVDGRKDQDLEYLVFMRYSKRLQRALTVAKAIRARSDRWLLGCDDAMFINHLEATFTDGMNWEKYRSGHLQIDHVTPCACFDLILESHQFICFNYRNTRMLWASDNVGKSMNVWLTADQIASVVSSALK